MLAAERSELRHDLSGCCPLCLERHERGSRVAVDHAFDDAWELLSSTPIDWNEAGFAFLLARFAVNQRLQSLPNGPEMHELIEARQLADSHGRACSAGRRVTELLPELSPVLARLAWFDGPTTLVIVARLDGARQRNAWGDVDQVRQAISHELLDLLRAGLAKQLQDREATP